MIMTNLLRKVAVAGPALVFIAAMLWATDAPFRSQLTQVLSSNFIVFAEHGVDCIIALPILLLGWRELRGLSVKEWLAVGFIAIAGSAIASIAFTESFRYVNPSISILLQKTQPLIAIILARIVLGERLHKNFWIWTCVALVGAYLITFPTITPKLYASEVFNPNMFGIALALFAAALWGASTVFGRFVLRNVSFSTITGLRFVTAFVFLGVLNAVQGTFPDIRTVPTVDWLFIIAIAIASGVLSLYLYYFGLQFTRASIATIAELGFPFAAVFVNAYFIPSDQQAGMFLGLFAGQWVGSIILLIAVFMLMRVNRQEVEHRHIGEIV